MRKVLGAILLLLALTPAAHAGGFVWTLEGPKYGHAHHWYTDDCNKWHRRVDHSCEDGQQSFQHHRAPRPKQSEQCDLERASYYLRHPGRTPSGLRHLHGCVKYRRDWDYHEVTLPAVEGVAAQFRILAINLRNNTLEALE